MIDFIVEGNPIPKQSFKMGKHGGYPDKRVTAWQDHVAWIASAAMAGYAPMQGDVAVRLIFYRKTRHKVDLGNLEKPVCDAMNNIVYDDDSQIHHFELWKEYDKENPRVEVRVWELENG